MKTIQEFQAEHMAWVKHNFPGRPAHYPLLGIGEEVGELKHAVLKDLQGIRGTQEEHYAKQQDAIADIMIFASDYCTALGWDLQDIIGHETFFHLQGSLLQTRMSAWQVCLQLGRDVGDLDALHLLNERSVGASGRDVAGLFFHLADFCNLRGWSMQGVFEETWAKVQKRDWQKDKKTGGDLDAPTVTEGVDKTVVSMLERRDDKFSLIGSSDLDLRDVKEEPDAGT